MLDYPLRFAPVFRRYLWGGRKLGTVLAKPIGAGEDYAESWEVVDHGEDQSVVSHGPLAGRTLSSLVHEYGAELLGAGGDTLDQFPLLLKLLDCNRNLSVQVHPNDAQGARLDPPDNGKTEAWYILDCEPGSCLYAGLKEGCSPDDFRHALRDGQVEATLRKLYPETGQAILIPAGTIHALATGLLVAEIQQSSDTTYRLFDWNRLGSDGQPRALHIEQGLAVIDWESRPQLTPVPDDAVATLVACDKFSLTRRVIGGTQRLPASDRFRILLVIHGELTLAPDPAGPLALGQSVLVPAGLAIETQAESEAVVLEMA